MGILANEHIEKALELGLVRLESQRDIGAFSIDVSLGDELFRPSTGEKVKIPGDGLVVTPDDFYLWEFPSDLFLSKGIYGEVSTRSSYARLGISVSSDACIDYMRYGSHEDREFRPVCTLTTYGTFARVRPGETIGQLILRTRFTESSVSDLKNLMELGELVIKENDKTLSVDEVSFNEGLELTLDDLIHVYNPGRILDPQTGVNEGEFSSVDLTSYPEGYFLGEWRFFISSSVQEIATSNRFVSFVTPYISSRSIGFSFDEPEPFFRFMPFRTHPNAPYHAFGFDALRQITFENQVTDPNGVYLHAGMKQAELLVIPLFGPSDYSKQSRYHGQEGATLMRRKNK